MVRDDSDEYRNSLADAIVAITSDNYGSVSYKGFKIYYTYTPEFRSLSLEDGHKDYYFNIRFESEAMLTVAYTEYHSEEEKIALRTPGNEYFEETGELLDRKLELIDDGRFLKKKKIVGIQEFKDNDSMRVKCDSTDWGERCNDANYTFSLLLKEAGMRSRGHEFSQRDFEMFVDIIRGMVFLQIMERKMSFVNLQPSWNMNGDQKWGGIIHMELHV